ncbi:Alpha/Beta hydrolase protein [Hyaloraphidium curvatum]|nr:Alpha/Beta hydrolase protein [Hyaloraphidium curvatum]
MHRSALALAAALAVLGLPRSTVAQSAAERCQFATSALEFVLSAYENPSPPLAAIIAAAAQAPPPPSPPELYPAAPYSWAAYNAQGLLSTPGSLFAEAQTALTNASLTMANASVGTVDTVYGNWGAAWYALGDRVAAAAAAQGVDATGRAGMLLRASSYYFLGQWAFPTAPAALDAARKSREAFRGYLASSGLWHASFNATFSNGTATALLPCILVSPDPSRKLPLVLAMTGLDYFKEVYYATVAPPALARGFAVLVFEGPGQGAVVREPPFMPFVRDYDRVVAAVLAAARTDAEAAPRIDFARVALWANSLGGFLGGVACSDLPAGTLAACVLNPPVYDLGQIYADKSSLAFEPFFYLANSTGSGPGGIPAALLPAFANSSTAGDLILRPLLLDCAANSSGYSLLEVLFSSAPGPIDPELSYLAFKYAGSLSPTQQGLYAAVPLGMARVLAYNNPNVSRTPVPVLGFAGGDDDSLGGQEAGYFSRLPANAKNKLISYPSGDPAALHCQAGAYLVSGDAGMAWLEGVMNASQSTATRPSGALARRGWKAAMGWAGALLLAVAR